ncbi:MAG: response regulator transcription factor [Saprospiraceae bacterium]
MKILLIEDEQDLADSIISYLKENDFKCEHVSMLDEAMGKISLHQYDCILLDLMLPDGNGFEILKEIKKQNKAEGIIIISAKQSVDTRVEGLQLGADDYLTKPFHLSELMARVQSLLRRKNFQGNNVVLYNELEIDLLAKTVKANAQPIEVTKKEMDLLLFLIGNQNKVLSKGAIAEHLSGDMADMLDNHDFVYAHIKNLKRKLSEAGCPDYIRTVYGLGYKWQ